MAVNLILQEIEDFFCMFELVRLSGLSDNIEKDFDFLVAGYRLGYVVASAKALVVQSFSIELLINESVVEVTLVVDK